MDLCGDCGAKVDRVVKLWSLKERPSAPSISFLRLRRQSAGVSVSANACPVMSTGPRRFHPPIQMHIDGHRWTMKLRISCFRFFFDTSRSAFPADSPASGVLKRHVLRQIWSHQGESMYSQYGLEGKDVSVMHNGSFSAEVFHF